MKHLQLKYVSGHMKCKCLMINERKMLQYRQLLVFNQFFFYMSIGKVFIYLPHVFHVPDFQLSKLTLLKNSEKEALRKHITCSWKGEKAGFLFRPQLLPYQRAVLSF